MPLRKQKITVPLSGSVQDKVDDKLLPIGKLSQLENGTFNKLERIDKRFGFDKVTTDSLPYSSTITDFSALMHNKKELLGVADNADAYSFGSNSLHSFSPTVGKWLYKDRFSTALVEGKQIKKGFYNLQNPDVAYSNGLALVTWDLASTGVYATLYDTVNDCILLDNVQVSATGERPRVVANNKYFYVYYVIVSTTKLCCKRLPILNPTAFESEITLTSALQYRYNIAKHGNNFVIAYETTAPKIYLGYLAESGNLAGATDGFPVPVQVSAHSARAIGLYSSYDANPISGKIHLFYVQYVGGATDQVQYVNYNFNLTVNTALGSLEALASAANYATFVATVISPDDSTVYGYFDRVHTSGHPSLVRELVFTSAGSLTTAVSILADYHRITSTCFMRDQRPIMMIGHKSLTQGGYHLVEMRTGRVMNALSRVSYLYGSGEIVYQNCESGVARVDANTYYIASQFANRLITEEGTVSTQFGVQLNKFNFNINDLYEYTDLGGLVYFAGGQLSCYDGATVFESGYNAYPELITATPDNTAGNLVAGTRSVVVVYEYYDSQGLLHRSAPSIPVTYATTGGTSKCVYTIPYLNLTRKLGVSSASSVSIAVYRTLANSAIYYRVTSLTSPTFNNTLSDYLAFTDGDSTAESDASIASNEILYTTSGELEPIAPPSCKLIVTYRNRLVIAGLESPNEFWYSKEYEQGIAAEFSDQLRYTIEEGDGGITSLGVLDDKLILFKKDTIFVVAGNGPDKTGNNNDYNIPQRIASDVGCTYPRSIVQYPQGLLFKSLKGWYLLDRTLNVTYIGAAVEDSNNLTVTSSTLLANKNEIRITHSDGYSLVYNYLFDNWGRSTYSAIDAIEVDEQYYKISNDTFVYEESDGYLDDGTNIKMKVVTPWIATGGVQGFQRVWRACIIGSYLSKHTIRVRIAYDYEPFYSDTYELSSESMILSTSYYGSSTYYGASSLFGENQSLLEQVEVKPTRQKCMAIRFEITDLNADLIDGAGLSLNRLDLEVGVKVGNNKFENERTLRQV